MCARYIAVKLNNMNTETTFVGQQLLNFVKEKGRWYIDLPSFIASGEGIKDDLINAGAHWVDESAFTEGNLVWGRVVADIPNFCRELVTAFNK